MIKHIFLDLDDTLLDFHFAENIAIRATFSEFNIDPTDDVIAKYRKINRASWEKLERGEWSREEVLYGRFELLFRELGINENPVAVQSMYENKLCIGHYFMDGAEELLDTLARKYKLYITSNGTARVQDSRIASSGIIKYFDGIFISGRIGAEKPSVKFFDAVFSSIDGFRRDEAIIFGDSMTSDILGGLRAGIHTCLYNPKNLENTKDFSAEYEVSHLLDFIKIVEEIK